MFGPYKNLDLSTVKKPIQYLGGEPGEIINHVAKTKAVLAFPDVYEIGMSHLGIRVLYEVVNRDPSLRLERVFAPWPDMEKLLRTKNHPLVTLETGTPLKEFPIVGFSLQFEMTYTGILQILELGGIPILRSQRREDDPIVIAGGPNATHPEPLVDFIDIFAIGDGEKTLPWLMHEEYLLRSKGIPRKERIRILGSNPHLYAPSTRRIFIHKRTNRIVVGDPLFSTEPKRITPSILNNIDDIPSTVGGPRPYMAVFARASIEIARGCTQGCRFCQAGFIYRPMRERHPNQILNDVEEALSYGEEEISLTALSTLDYTSFEDLIDLVAIRVKDSKGSVGISSLRAYGLSDNFLEKLRTGRGGGLTFAPEAGSQRLRDAINKNVKEEDLLESVYKVAKLGWSRVKLYFILGLPTETLEDLEAIPELGHKAFLEGKKAVKGIKKLRAPKITCSMSSLVPKPHTPYQWIKAMSLDEIIEKQRIVRHAGNGKRVKLKFHDPKISLLESIFARGDRRLGKVIFNAYRLGARFDGWEEFFDFSLWEQAFKESNIDMADYLIGYEQDDPLPWDHISVGVSKEFLWSEYQKTINSQPTPPCFHLKPPKVIPCHVCGAECDLKDRRSQLFNFINFFAQFKSSAGGAGEKENSSERLSKHKQLEDIRLRIIFSKQGDGRYFGHGDLLGLLPRIFRASGLDLKYSQGFNPKPRMVFAPPVPFGIESFSEMVEVRVESKPWIDFPKIDGAKELINNLNFNAPRGIKFLHIEPSDIPLQKDIIGAVYKTRMPLKKSFNISKLYELVENGKIERQREGKESIVFDLSKEIRKVMVDEKGYFIFELFIHQGPSLSPKELLNFLNISDSYQRISFLFNHENKT